MYRCLLACTSLHRAYAWCPQKSAEGVRVPGTGVTNCREPLCVCWELTLDSLKVQSVLLTTELSLQTASVLSRVLQGPQSFKWHVINRNRFCFVVYVCMHR